MRTRGKILALGAFFVALALLVAGCGSSVPSNSVASVGGVPISHQAYRHWFYIYAKGSAAQQGTTEVFTPSDPPGFASCVAQVRAQVAQLAKQPTATLRKDCGTLFTSDNSAVLGYLISAYWYQAEAHKLGISVTPAQVQKALAATEKMEHITSQTQLRTVLAQGGQTIADAEFQTRVNQLQEKILRRHEAPVTQTAIASYYSQHKTTFGTPERRNLRIVLAKNAAQANAALRALKHGQSWTTVAAKYSQDPQTKSHGGLLSGATTASLGDATFARTAFTAPTGKLLGPIKGQFGYYVAQVLKVTPAVQQSLAQVTPTIKTTLTQQNQQTAETAVANMVKKSWISKTHCASGYSMQDCPGYKPPKTTTSPTATATAPESTSPTAPATSTPTTATSSSTSSSASSSH